MYATSLNALLKVQSLRVQFQTLSISDMIQTVVERSVRMVLFDQNLFDEPNESAAILFIPTKMKYLAGPNPTLRQLNPTLTMASWPAWRRARTTAAQSHTSIPTQSSIGTQTQNRTQNSSWRRPNESSTINTDTDKHHNSFSALQTQAHTDLFTLRRIGAGRWGP